MAQPQPGLREGLARATSTPAPVPQPAAVPQPPPPMKSDGQVAQKVVRKKKVKKPVAPVVAKRVGPPVSCRLSLLLDLRRCLNKSSK